MERRTVLKTTGLSALALVVGSQAKADDNTEASFDIARRFMGAMGSGDMETVRALMSDDMVWHNEGDTTLPWVSGSEGKKRSSRFWASSHQISRPRCGRIPTPSPRTIPLPSWAR